MTSASVTNCDLMTDRISVIVWPSTTHRDGWASRGRTRGGHNRASVHPASRPQGSALPYSGDTRGEVAAVRHGRRVVLHYRHLGTARRDGGSSSQIELAVAKHASGDIVVGPYLAAGIAWQPTKSLAIFGEYRYYELRCGFRHDELVPLSDRERQGRYDDSIRPYPFRSLVPVRGGRPEKRGAALKTRSARAALSDIVVPSTMRYRGEKPWRRT